MRPCAEQRLFRSIPRCYLDLEGRPRALRVSGKPTKDNAGRHVGWRGTATDVTVEIEARKTAEFLSGHDALTGCLNRQGLIEGTTELLDAARRRDQLAAFLLLDLDRFKEVNDIHGPIVGDQLIRAVAQKLDASGPAGRCDRAASAPTSSCWSARRSATRRRCSAWPSRCRTSWRSRWSSAIRRSRSRSAWPRSCCPARPRRPSARCMSPAW